MQIRYRDEHGERDSAALRRMIALSRWIPEPLYDKLIWRMARRFQRRVGLRNVSGIDTATRWGYAVELVGDGTITFQGSFSIGRQVCFEISAPGLFEADTGLKIDRGSIVTAYRGNIRLGSRVYIGPHCFLQSESNLVIGRDTMIGSHVKILAYNLGITERDVPYRDQPLTSKGISIGSNVWIGAGAAILDGVTIGDDAVVAAGAVVTQSLQGGVLAGGVPAHVIRNVHAGAEVHSVRGDVPASTEHLR